MSGIFICGTGAVSPAGWGVPALREALARGEPLPAKDLERPGCSRPLRVRSVPAPVPRPQFTAHARLRRTSPITQHAVGAALEALGTGAAQMDTGSLKIGVILCAMSGCVNYSRRFYCETLKDPSTASPVIFPETVFNAPASHLAALLGTRGINYTLVGDPGTFLQGIAVAADWLLSERLDGCLVVGAEELDWLTTDAFRLFDPQAIVSEGAGALYLRRGENSFNGVRLDAITQAHSYSKNQTRHQAAQLARNEIGDGDSKALLCDGVQGVPRLDRAEHAVWQNWPGSKLSVKTVLGEGLMAAGPWQCVAAIDALQQNRYTTAVVSVLGCNQQAIAARFMRAHDTLVA